MQDEGKESHKNEIGGNIDVKTSCRVLTWNINGAPNTFENIKLRHGSLKGFAEENDLDLICIQVQF